MTCMAPLLKLIEANVNYTRIQELVAAKKQVPIFRVEALENIFCQLLSGLCEIFRDQGDLKKPFNIVAMVNVLKIS